MKLHRVLPLSSPRVTEQAQAFPGRRLPTIPPGLHQQTTGGKLLQLAPAPTARAKKLRYRERISGVHFSTCVQDHG